MSNERIIIKDKDISSGKINNENKTITSYWEKINDNNNYNKNIKIIPLILEIIQKAKESVIIYSPKITSSELMLTLENIGAKGVRIYLLVSDIKIHKDIVKKTGVVREKTDIASTFVLIDTKGESPEGLWFSGELTSKQEDVPFVLKLNTIQAKEAFAHFSHYFWNSRGTELFFGKERKALELKPRLPEIRERLIESFRKDGYRSLIGCDIHYLWLPSKIPELLRLYCSESKNIIVEMNVKIKDSLLLEDLKETALYSVSKMPFCCIGLDKYILFKEDIGFILTDEQMKSFLNIFSLCEWIYHTEGRIKDIKNKIIFYNSDWKDGNIISDSEKKSLGVLNSRTLDEWMKGKPDPVIPDEILLARSIEFQWTLKPPYLPEKASKHRLYNKWGTFEKDMRDEINELFDEIKTIREDKNILEKTTKEKKFSEWENELNNIRNKDWKLELSKATLEEALRKINDIRTEIKNESERASDKTEENEIEASKSKKDKSQNKGDKKKNRKFEIPYKPLPLIGELYELGNDTYLAIRHVDEIEKAKIIAEYYHAKLVAIGLINK